jgi:hypothetical protein
MILRNSESDAAVVCVKAVHESLPHDQTCKWPDDRLYKKMSPQGFSATGVQMARELDIKGRRYWVLSEPDGSGWKASVVEVRDDGSSEQIGIDASGETRNSADDAAERKLRLLLQAC